MRRTLSLALVVLALAACEGTSTPPYPLVASGDTWDLGFGRGVRGGAPCFALDDPNGSFIRCVDLDDPDLGRVVVDPLGSGRSLVYGAVPTHAVTVAVTLEDGSSVATNPFAPPADVTIERNLFALELDQPRGSAITTLFDGGGDELASAELRWTEDVGGIFGFATP